MRDNKYLYTFKKVSSLLFTWCLIVTTFVAVGNADVDEDLILYDSSLQRSNFFSIKPRYQKTLDDKLENRRAALLWKMRFDAQSLETDQNIQAQRVGATAGTKFRYKLIDNLDFKARVNVTLQSGRSQSIFGDLQPFSAIYSRELILDWEPIDKHLFLQFGQISQRWLNQPLFIGNLGFPGLQQKVKYSNDRLEVSATAQQLIPTSATLSTRVGEREPLPNLFTETLAATWNISDLNFIGGKVTHFRYENLPSIVAFESFVYGNTVTNSDINNAEFIYGFEGFLTQVAFEQKITDNLAAQVQWDTIINDEAPSTAGEAQSITASVANDFGRWILMGKYVNYFIESDAVPAFYNSHVSGHNNRLGNAYEVQLESKDWGVVFKGIYTRANLLNPTTQRIDGLQQDDQQTIYFAVETLYDFI